MSFFRISSGADKATTPDSFTFPKMADNEDMIFEQF